LRREVREKRSAQPDGAEISPAELAAMEETRRRVVAAVLALPEPQRGVILLRHWSGLSCAEIAARRDENESTVRNRLMRAHEKLREALDADFGDRASWRHALLPFVSGAPWVSVSVATSTTLGGIIMALKGKVAIVAACLIVGSASYWLFDGAAPDLGDNVREIEQSVVANREPRVDGAEHAAPSTGDSDSTSARDQVRAEDAAKTGLYVLRVVRAPDNEPIPHAEVRVRRVVTDVVKQFEHNRSAGFFEDWNPERDLASAELRVANEHGEIELDADGSRYVVCSRHGDWFGYDSIETKRAARRSDLVLANDPNIEVLVTDSAGAPLRDTPVSVEFEFAGHPEPHTVVRATTDASGVAIVQHLAERLSMRGSGTPRYFVTLGGPIAAKPRIALDPEALPKERLHLVAPPLGSVVVEFVTPEGAPHLNLLAVGVGTAPLSESVFPQAADLWWTPTERGRATFAAGVGAEVGLYVCAPDGSIDPVRAEFVGPQGEGEMVRQSVKIGARRRVLRAQAIDPNGAPLSRLAIRGEFGFGGRPWYGHDEYVHNALTDEAGGFELPISEAVRAMAPESLDLTCEDRATGRRWRVALPFALGADQAADITLGALRFEAPPLLVAGRVIDEAGRGVEGVFVGVRNANPAKGVEQPKWCETGIGGAYEWRDWIDAGVTRLKVQPLVEGHFARLEPEVEPGATNVDIVVVRGGRLEGSIALEPGIDPAALFVVLGGGLSTELSSILDRGETRQSPRPDGTFAFDALKAGVASLTVLDADTEIPSPILRFDDLVIEAGNTNRDPRIQNISLGAITRRTEVTVVDIADRPIEGALLRLRPGEAMSGPSRTRLTNDKGRAAPLLARESHSLLVTKAGHRSVYVPIVGQAQTITLPPALEVRVVVRGGADDARHQVRLTPASAEPADTELQEQWLESRKLQLDDLGPGGVVTFQVVEPGSFVVSVNEYIGPARLKVVASRTIDIEEDDGVREIEIDLADAQENEGS
jgi:Sigma-70, region 4